MNEKIKAHLAAYCQKNNWELNDKNFTEVVEEILSDAKPLFKEITGTHRWYEDEFRVVNIDGMLIGFDWYHNTGDNSFRDMDLRLKLESINEVVKKQKTVDYYEKA